MIIALILVSLIIAVAWLVRNIHGHSEWFESLLAVIAAVLGIISYVSQADENADQLAKFKQELNHKTREINDKQDSIAAITDTLLKAQRHLARYENSPSVSGNDVSGDNNNLIAANNSTVNITNGEKRPDITLTFSVSGYINTGIQIGTSDRVVISAGGSLSAGPNVGPTSPEGIHLPGLQALLAPFQIDNRYAHASLLYKLSEGMPWSFCGHGCEITGQEGQIIFEINDNRKEDNKGYYEVIVKVYRQRAIAARTVGP